MRSVCAILNIFRPIPIFVARLWRRKLDYAKILQAKYFTGENIPIYGMWVDLYQVIKVTLYGSLDKPLSCSNTDCEIAFMASLVGSKL